MRQKYIHKRIPIRRINVLPQVRQTFDVQELWGLANDIASNGIIQPSIVTALTRDEMIQHLELESRINKIKLSIEDMYQSSDGYYYRLIAGERRYRAHFLLLNFGCEDCQKKGRSGQECYDTHFQKGSMMEVRVGMHITAVKAKSIQFRENTYVQPPLDEEAYSYQETFLAFKSENPKYTIKKFAKFAGVGVEKVRRALIFVSLPDDVRQSVKERKFTFSHAIEFKQLLDAVGGDPQHPLFRNAYDTLCLKAQLKVEAFRLLVRASIESQNQIGLFGETTTLTKKEKRGVVERELIPYFSAVDRYVSRLLQEQRRGRLGKGKPLSGSSPNRQVRKILNRLEELIPGFRLTAAQREAINRLDFEAVTTLQEG